MIFRGNMRDYDDWQKMVSVALTIPKIFSLTSVTIEKIFKFELDVNGDLISVFIFKYYLGIREDPKKVPSLKARLLRVGGGG